MRWLIDRGIGDELPDREAAYARADERVGEFRDPEGAKDVAEHHDDYLEDAYR